MSSSPEYKLLFIFSSLAQCLPQNRCLLNVCQQIHEWIAISLGFMGFFYKDEYKLVFYKILLSFCPLIH